VLGAEDALFAHLRGHAPSPKHGAIYTHDYVRGTHPEQRGSAARALAGKLTIAARIDHYSGTAGPTCRRTSTNVSSASVRVIRRDAARRSRTAGVRGESDDSLATQGEPVYGEPVSEGWRRWNPHRSKLGATFEKNVDTGLSGGDAVLYLGAANGTTVSHVADFAGADVRRGVRAAADA